MATALSRLHNVSGKHSFVEAIGAMNTAIKALELSKFSTKRKRWLQISAFDVPSERRVNKSFLGLRFCRLLNKKDCPSAALFCNNSVLCSAYSWLASLDNVTGRCCFRLQSASGNERVGFESSKP